MSVGIGSASWAAPPLRVDLDSSALQEAMRNEGTTNPVGPSQAAAAAAAGHVTQLVDMETPQIARDCANLIRTYCNHPAARRAGVKACLSSRTFVPDNAMTSSCGPHVNRRGQVIN